jgi:hypothetical protein
VGRDGAEVLGRADDLDAAVAVAVALTTRYRLSPAANAVAARRLAGSVPGR